MHQDSAPFECLCKIDLARRTVHPPDGTVHTRTGAGAVGGLRAVGGDLQMIRDRAPPVSGRLPAGMIRGERPQTGAGTSVCKRARPRARTGHLCPWGRSGHGLRFRRGAAAPEAVVQPKSAQRHAK